VLRHGRHDLAVQGHVPLQQVQPGLPGDLPRARSDDHEVRVLGDRGVGAGDDADAREERGGVLQVERLAAELVGERVDQRDLVGEVLGEDGLRDGHAHVAGADDGDFREAAVRGGGGEGGVVGDGAEEARRGAGGVEAQLRQRRGLVHLRSMEWDEIEWNAGLG